MKVFDTGENDFVAAETLEQAREFYREFVSGPEHDELEFRELTPEEMKTMKHWGEDGANYKNPLTFEEELAKDIREGTKFPCVFASREW